MNRSKEYDEETFLAGYANLVRVGNHSIHMEHTTKSAFDAKKPVVIFDAGYGDTSASWGRVQPSVSKFAPTILFDRAG